MKKLKIRYFTARKVVFFAMLASMAMLMAYLYVDSRVLQKALLITASFVFFGSFLVMTAFFRCPVCGCPFMRKALMITKCPACGHKLNDFYLGQKIKTDRELDLYGNLMGLTQDSDEEDEEDYYEDEDDYYEDDFEAYADEAYDEETDTVPEEE